MALEYWRSRQLQKGNKPGAKIAEGLIEQYGDVPLPKSAEIIEPKSETSSLPELDLDTEWNTQAAKLAELFARVLGMSKDEYRESLPRFFPQPKAYKGRFDTPLIVPVHPELGIEKTAHIAGIKTDYNNYKIGDWGYGQEKFTTPQMPYTTWVDDGQKSLGKSFQDIRRMLAPSVARGGNIYDGIALYLKNPAILNDYTLFLPGSYIDTTDRDVPYPISQVDIDSNVPYLANFMSKTRLTYTGTYYEHRYIGSLVAGREIRTK